MKKIFIVFLILFSSLCLFAFAAVNSRIIDLDSDLYDYMDALYALNNKAKPETNRPWTEAQARLILESVDKTKQSGSSLKLYEEAEKIIKGGSRWKVSDDFGYSFVPELNIEGYFHTNDKDITHSSQWVRGYVDRKPWLKIGMDFSVSNFFWSCSDIQWRISRLSHKDEYVNFVDGNLATQSSGNGKYYIASYEVSRDGYYPLKEWFFNNKVATNLSFDTYDFDFLFPHRAIVSVGGKNWNVSVNRDRRDIGDAHIGNLLVDDHTDYNDYINVKFFSKVFTYDWDIMFLNTITSDSEDIAEEGRIFLIHSLDFRIWDRINFKVSENVIYKYKTLEFQYFNPAYIYHNLNNSSMFNAIALAEINASIIPGLNIYGQFCLDQARAPNEGDAQADASGLVAGVEYTVAGLGGVFENYIEIAGTTPELYRRRYVDFVKASRYYHQSGDNIGCGQSPVFEYIGFPFGGDTHAIVAGSKYSQPGFINAEISAMILEKGEMNIFKSHTSEDIYDGSPDIKEKTPSGDIITRALVASAKVDMSLGKFFNWPDVSFMTEADFVATARYNKITKEYFNKTNDLQISVGVSCKF